MIIPSNNLIELIKFIKQPMMKKYVRDRGFPLSIHVNFFTILPLFLVMSIYVVLKYSQVLKIEGAESNKQNVFIQRSLNQKGSQAHILKHTMQNSLVIRCNKFKFSFKLCAIFLSLMSLKSFLAVTKNGVVNLYQMRELVAYQFASKCININTKINSITIGNDHCGLEIGLIDQAKEKGIKTFYVQHAEVNKYFPRIEIDNRFLFNLHSSKIYGLAEDNFFYLVRDNSFLAADLKIVLEKAKVGKPLSIGIGLNSIPSIVAVEKLIESLECENVDLTVRLHPSTRDSVFRKLGPKLKKKVRSGPLIDWLEGLALVFAGNSGLLIDSLLYGKPSVYCNNLDYFDNDYYGFVEAGFVYEIKNLSNFDLVKITEFYDLNWKKEFFRNLVDADKMSFHEGLQNYQ